MLAVRRKQRPNATESLRRSNCYAARTADKDAPAPAPGPAAATPAPAPAPAPTATATVDSA